MWSYPLLPPWTVPGLFINLARVFLLLLLYFFYDLALSMPIYFLHLFLSSSSCSFVLFLLPLKSSLSSSSSLRLFLLLLHLSVAMFSSVGQRRFHCRFSSSALVKVPEFSRKGWRKWRRRCYARLIKETACLFGFTLVVVVVMVMMSLLSLETYYI